MWRAGAQNAATRTGTSTPSMVPSACCWRRCAESSAACCSSVLPDLILTTVGLKLVSSGSGGTRHAAPGSMAAPALVPSAAGVLGSRTVRRIRLGSATGGAAARSRLTFSSKVEDPAGREIQRDRVGAGGHARTLALHARQGHDWCVCRDHWGRCLRMLGSETSARAPQPSRRRLLR